MRELWTKKGSNIRIANAALCQLSYCPTPKHIRNLDRSMSNSNPDPVVMQFEN
jgi:hypothetical protein